MKSGKPDNDVTPPVAEHRSGGGHNAIVVELSNRVSEQDARIVQLENLLHEKNTELSRLQHSVKRDEVNSSDSHSFASASRRELNDTSLNTSSHLKFEFEKRKTNCDGSTNDMSSRSLPARSRTHCGVDANNSDSKSELQAIANEMRALRTKQTRRASKNKTATTIPEFAGERQTSAGSGASSRAHSGVARYDADVSHCDSDTGFSDRSDDVRGDVNSPAVASNYSGDRSNIRKISGSRRKRSAKESDTDGDVTRVNATNGKPPAYKSRSNDLSRDVDALIRTIDSID